MRPTVILLSFNSEDTLSATLSSARQVSDEIFVVDSYSNDRTVELARSLGATVVQHSFEHYGAQRNWAIDNLPISRPWQLHLDADEWMDSRLVAAIQALPDEPEHAGYFVPRYLRFLGRVLRHGGMSPTWHLRLFRSGVGRCENRQYDQHFLLAGGTSGKLPGAIVDDVRMPLTEWTARHNRWADSEVAELEKEERAGRLQPDHEVDGALREKNRNGEGVGTAERVKDRRCGGRIAAEFGLLERAHRRQAIIQNLGPSVIQVVPMSNPGRIVLQFGKRAIRSPRKTS